jgi:hypothetical protein
VNAVMEQSVHGRATPNFNRLWIMPGSVTVPPGMVNGPYLTTFVKVAAWAGEAGTTPMNSVAASKAARAANLLTTSPLDVGWEPARSGRRYRP